jgi:hypothetical protein
MNSGTMAANPLSVSGSTPSPSYVLCEFVHVIGTAFIVTLAPTQEHPADWEDRGECSSHSYLPEMAACQLR